MTSRALLLVTFLGVVTSCRGDSVDATRTPGSSGSDVVNAVVEVIKSKCILSEDRQFLRRLAYVESLDGTRTDTYRDGYDGGIWKVNQQMFSSTTSCSSAVLRPFCDIIQQEFNIDWTKVTWSDLRKPLYSGLAAALYLIQRTGSSTPIPADIEGQGTFWAHYYHAGAPTANFTSIAGQATLYDCEDDMDLVFIVDSSGSISDPDFNLSVNFVAKIVESMNIPSVVRVATLIFDTSSTVEFYLNSHSTKNQVLQAIRNIQRTSGSTATNLALDAARQIVFTVGKGARALGTTKRVAVLVTDGQSNVPSATALAAQRLREEAGVTVFSIGVGGYDLAELQAVASEPKCSHVFTLSDFSVIDSILNEIQRSACNANTKLTSGGIVTSKNTTTITAQAPTKNQSLVVKVTCGIAHVYVSYTNPNPNPALYSEVYTARDGRPAYLTSESTYNGRPVYMTVIGSRLPETPGGLEQCPDFNISVGVEEKHWEVKCCIDSQCHTCTDEELRQDHRLREVVCNSNYVEFPNPCTPEAMGAGHVIFPYPYDLGKFIRCDYRGNAYVTLCPNRQTFNPATMTCGYETPGYSQVIPLPSTYPNPCTPAHLHAQYFYFEYEPNKQMFIHCDLWGNAFLEKCPALEIWSQELLTCVADRPGNVATTRAPVTVHNPCTPTALAASIYFHPYPCDHTRYIHCDIGGNYWVQFCPGGLFFNPETFICVVGDPQHGQHGCD